MEENFSKPAAYKSINSSSFIDPDKKEVDVSEENIFETDANTIFYEMLIAFKNLFV